MFNISQFISTSVIHRNESMFSNDIAEHSDELCNMIKEFVLLVALAQLVLHL